jgi:hypothetical protein
MSLVKMLSGLNAFGISNIHGREFKLRSLWESNNNVTSRQNPTQRVFAHHRCQAMTPVSQCEGQSANWTKLWRARPKRVGRKIAIADDGFGARAAAREVDDGVPGSPQATPAGLSA